MTETQQEWSSSWNMAERRMEIMFQLEVSYLEAKRGRDVRETWERAIDYYEQAVTYMGDDELAAMDELRSEIDLELYDSDEGDTIGSLYDGEVTDYRRQMAMIQQFMRKIKRFIFDKGIDIPSEVQQNTTGVENAIAYYRKYS